MGHANQGVEVEVTLGELTRKATANDLQQWSVEFPPLKASTVPISLNIKSSHGHSRFVKDILVGDVWYLTGSTQLTSEMAFDTRSKDTTPPETMPLIKEFRRKTKASSFPTPRKRKLETGGGRYRSSWKTADFTTPDQGVTMFAYHFAKQLNRKEIPQGFITMSSGQGGRNRQMASPLAWTSFQGVKNIRVPEFQQRLNELFIQYPNTQVARDSVDQHLKEVQSFVDQITSAKSTGEVSLGKAPLAGPAFPEAGKNTEVPKDMIPTYVYNWCVSPMTPMAISGVIWIPNENNIGYQAAEYARELEIYSASLQATYGEQPMEFLYAQPTSTLVPDITAPKIQSGKKVSFDQWPKSLKDIAI